MKERLGLIVSVFILLILSILIRNGREIPVPTKENSQPILETTSTVKEGSPTSIKLMKPTSSSKIATSSSKKVSSTPSLFSQIKNLFPGVQTTITATTSLPVSPTTTATVSSLPEQPIDPQSIVGILCYYTYSLEHPTTHQLIWGSTAKKGSGVIIDPRGYIITSRHLLEWPDEVENMEADGKNYSVTIHYSFKGCDTGRVPAGTVAPSKDLILSVNPATQVLVLGYRLDPVLVSKRYPEMTINESLFADFALLKISGISDQGATFGLTSLPGSFAFAKLLSLSNTTIDNKEVLTYGFPGDVTVGRGSDFETLYLTGSVGRITEVVNGERFYAGVPLYVKTKMEIYSGRSGSPLFWKGYVIGLITAEDAANRTNSYSVTSDIILKDIKGYIN